MTSEQHKFTVETRVDADQLMQIKGAYQAYMLACLTIRQMNTNRIIRRFFTRWLVGCVAVLLLILMVLLLWAGDVNAWMLIVSILVTLIYIGLFFFYDKFFAIDINQRPHWEWRLLTHLSRMIAERTFRKISEEELPFRAIYQFDGRAYHYYRQADDDSQRLMRKGEIQGSYYYLGDGFLITCQSPNKEWATKNFFFTDADNQEMLSQYLEQQGLKPLA